MFFRRKPSAPPDWLHCWKVIVDPGTIVALERSVRDPFANLLP